MLKINKHIEIVRSTTEGLSSMGPASADGILSALKKYYTHVGITVVNNSSDLKALVNKRPDLVFLGMKFILTNASNEIYGSDKIWIADYLDENGINYTGSNQLAHNLELDKSLAKKRLIDYGLKTARFYVIKHTQTPSTNVPITFPVFIKPTSLGGGTGINSASVANNFMELSSKVLSISNTHQSDSLIEEYLPGREFSVAILKNEASGEYQALPLELIAPLDERGQRILSGTIKSADTESFIELTDESIKARISTLALDVFYALGARDYGRIDIRLDQHGEANFLEANLIPSLLKNYGNFPKACKLNLDLNYEPMLLQIVNLALARDFNQDIFVPTTEPTYAILPSLTAALKSA